MFYYVTYDFFRFSSYYYRKTEITKQARFTSINRCSDSELTNQHHSARYRREQIYACDSAILVTCIRSRRVVGGNYDWTCKDASIPFTKVPFLYRD